MDPHKAARRIGVAAFVGGLGGGIAFPILPALGLKLGIPSFMIGVILSANRVTRLGCDHPAGVLVDRLGGRLPMACGLGIEGLGILCYSAALHFGHPVFWFLIGRILFGVGSAMLMVGAQASVLGLSNQQNRGRLTASVRMALSIGMPGGLMLGGVLADVVSDDAAFLVSSGLTLAGAAIVWLLAPDTRPATPPGGRAVSSGRGGGAAESSGPGGGAVVSSGRGGGAAESSGRGGGAAVSSGRPREAAEPSGRGAGPPERGEAGAAGARGVRAILGMPHIGVLAAIWSFNALVFMTVQGVLLATLVVLVGKRHVHMFGLGDQGTAGMVMAVMMACSTAMAFTIGRWIDRLPRRAVLVVPFLAVLAAGFAILGFAHTLAWMIVGIMLVGCAYNGVTLPLLALLGDLTQQRNYGRAVGIYQVFGDIGGSIGPVAGLESQVRFGLLPTYLGVAVVLLLSLLMALGVYRAEQPRALS